MPPKVKPILSPQSAVPVQTPLKKLKHKTWSRFVKNVSITGLLELYEAPCRLIRLLWIVTLLTAAGSIAYHVFQLVEKYLHQKPTFEIRQTADLVIPFPNVTACIPAGIYKTRARQLLEMPNYAKKKLAKMNLRNREKFYDDAVKALSFSLNFESLTVRNKQYRLMRDVATWTLSSFGEGLGSFYQITMPDCASSISNCYFNGQFYDCCKNALYQLSDGNVCYELPVTDADLAKGRKRYPWFPASFTFDLTMDWRHVLFYGGDAVDGFSLHLTDPLCFVGSPVAVPSGMHVRVEMSRPVRRIDTSDCLSNNFPPSLFGYYDPSAVHCLAQGLESFLVRHLGCYPPLESFVPNATAACSGTALFMLKLAMSGQLDGIDRHNNLNSFVHDHLRQLYYGPDRCLPVCTRWRYDPRPSYSQLVLPNDRGNFSRSRVTVQIGSSFYDERSENGRSFYSTFYSIGFATSLYTGMSIITFAEILFYGVEAFALIRKRRKVDAVSPKQKRQDEIVKLKTIVVLPRKTISKGKKDMTS